MCTHGPIRLYGAATAIAGSCIRGAGKVSGAGAGSQFIDKGLSLRDVAQLQLCSHQLTIALFQLVTQSLHSVGINECAGCFAFGVNSTGDFACVLSSIKANGIDIAVRLAILLSQRLFILYLLQFPISSDYIFTLYKKGFGTLVGIIGIHPHPLVVEPSRILLLEFSSLGC